MRNSIMAENALLGTSAWQLVNPAFGQVEGYASATSVAAGDSMSLHIRATSPRFRGQLYRLGWYDGLGGREVATLPEVEATAQPDPVMDERGRVRCDWDASYVIEIDPEWVSGLYLVRLETVYDDPDQPTEDAYVTFVVRDDTRTDHLLLQTAVNTYQAYNPWGGKSLYGATGSTNFDDRARAVSFDRPYAEGRGAGQLFSWEYSMARWLERSGYNVSYASNVDLDQGNSSFLTARAIVSAGHDEYWTQAMRNFVEEALANGVSLLFLGSNAIYWRVRYEDDGRTMVCYKDADAGSFDPVTDPAATTRLWRDPRVGRPEQELIGVMYNTFNITGNFPLRVTNTQLWPFAGTGLVDGDTMPGLVGYEMDQVFGDQPTPPVDILAESPVVGADGLPYVSHATIYGSGAAWVFAAGTNSWVWALDDLDLPFLGSEMGSSHNVSSVALQQVTRNVVAAMLAPRALAIDFRGGDLLTDATAGVVPTFVEPPGPESWLDGWTDGDDACLVGDFLDLGFDQVLLFNRQPEGGRFIIASLRGPGAEILLAEDWGASDWLDGWDDGEQLQLSGDFMGAGHDQVLFVNRTGAVGRVLIVDFASGPQGAQIRYFESRGQSPWLDGLDGDGRLRLVGDFADLGHDQVLFLEHGNG